MIEHATLAQDPELFNKIFPHAHPLARRLWNLRHWYSDDIPEELISNDPGVPQNEKARKGFWSSAITALDCLLDEGVIRNEKLRIQTRSFITYYQNHRFKNDKLTKPMDVKIANHFLDIGLKHALFVPDRHN